MPMVGIVAGSSDAIGAINCVARNTTATAHKATAMHILEALLLFISSPPSAADNSRPDESSYGSQHQLGEPSPTVERWNDDRKPRFPRGTFSNPSGCNSAKAEAKGLSKR